MKPLSRIIGLAFLLTACVQSEDIAPLETEAPVPVVFDTYIAAGNTRAQYPNMTLDIMQQTGFGVFAKTNNSETQDFMNNQKVEYIGTAWTYAPLKFWPGLHQTYEPETYNTLSFYAYAPYKDITEPKIPYTAANYGEWGEDLLWATLLREKIPASDAKTTLTFYHACVRLGLQVVANYDEEDNEGKTKILIESVKIEDGEGNPYSINALHTKGTLDLTNDNGEAPYQPYWTNLGDAFALPNVIDDTHHLNTELKYATLQPIGIPNSGVDENGFCARGTRSVKTI
ncbi:MAG: fimbrillin family protein, partial [Prevotella sp.]|nr:fimbrillin family protein [Prevotella sp.]